MKFHLPINPKHATHFNLLLFTALATLISIYLFNQNLIYLDRTFLPDDTYYTLSIARNLAQGKGPTADGVVLTSGFQPLIAFFLIPIFSLTDSLDLPVYSAIFISLIFGVASVGAAGYLAQKLTGSLGGSILCMLLIASSPLLLRNNLNGLETSLAALLPLLALCLLAYRPQLSTTYKSILIGLCLGLALLARIDNCFFALFIGLFLLKEQGVKATLLAAMVSFLTVLPWWLYCQYNFGTFIPESGAAVRYITQYHSELGRSFTNNIDSGLSILAQTIPLPGFLSYITITIVLGLLFKNALPALKNGVNLQGAISLTALSLLAFYIIYLPAFWFYERYLNLAYLLSLIILSVELQKIFTAKKAPFMAKLITVLLITYTLTGNLIEIRKLKSEPESTLYSGEQGAKGYGEIAQAVLAVLPNSSIISSMQSGALSYYSPHRSIRALNLDGVVNRFAHESLKKHNVGEYMLKSNAYYFADWALNANFLASHLGDLHITATPLMQFKPQGNDQFTLYKLDYSSKK